MGARSGRISAVFLGVVLACINCANSQFTGGKVIQSAEQFPHHVIVHRFNRNGEFVCGASVIHEKWLLTSARCVKGADHLTFDFRWNVLNSREDAFSITTDNSTIRLYPNEYDDVALVELPSPLQFSKTLKAIPLHQGNKPIERKLSVMVSSSSYNSSLTYGMYRILSKEKCTHLLDHHYNKFKQICAEAWSSSYHFRCRNLEGSALIVGWPEFPLLVGVLSSSGPSNNQSPVTYIRISEYVDWIIDTIHPGTSTTWPTETTGPLDWSTTSTWFDWSTTSAPFDWTTTSAPFDRSTTATPWPWRTRAL